MKNKDIKKILKEMGIILSDIELKELDVFINQNISELKDLERYLYIKEQDKSEQKESIEFLNSFIGDKNVKRDS